MPTDRPFSVILSSNNSYSGRAAKCFVSVNTGTPKSGRILAHPFSLDGECSISPSQRTGYTVIVSCDRWRISFSTTCWACMGRATERGYDKWNWGLVSSFLVLRRWLISGQRPHLAMASSIKAMRSTTGVLYGNALYLSIARWASIMLTAFWLPTF